MFLYEDAVREVVEPGFVEGLYRRDRSWSDGHLARERGFANFWVRGLEARLGLRALDEGRDLSVESEDRKYSWVLKAVLVDGRVRISVVDGKDSEVVGVFSRDELESVVAALREKCRVDGDGFRVLYAPSYTMVSRKNNASALLQRAR